MPRRLQLATVILHALACIAFFIAAIVSVRHGRPEIGFMFAFSGSCMLVSAMILYMVYRDERELEIRFPNGRL